MATVTTLLVDTCKPTFRPDATRVLVSHLLGEHSAGLGTIVADSLMEAIPPAMGNAIFGPLHRGGTRIAYQIIKLSFPSRLIDPKRLEPIRQLARLFVFIDAELFRRKAIVHREFVYAFRERLNAYFTLVNALRDLSTKENPNLALQGCLVERVVVAGAFEAHLMALLAASVLHEAAKDERALVANRVEATIPVAMADPYEPVFTDEERSLGQDILWQTIGGAEPTTLSALLNKVSAGNVMVADKTCKPRFSGALVKNPHFKAATARVPRILRERIA